MIFNSKVLFFYFSLIIWAAPSVGQAPSWLSNEGAIEATQVAACSSNIVVAGAFTQSWEGVAARGGTDLFLLQYASSGAFGQAPSIQQQYFLAGRQKEQWAALCAHKQGHLYGVGNFRDSLFFGDKDTVLYQNSSRVFVGQWSCDLVLQWARVLYSSNVVKVWDAQTDAQGALYLTGSFKDTLFLDSLPPLVAPCGQAPFLIKMNAQGQLIWGRSSRHCQEAEGKALALNEQGQVYWAGEFRGEFALDSAFQRAHAAHRDVFLTRLDGQTGQQHFQKQFAGVYDNQCVSLDWQEGVLYMAGHFRGYLHLDSFWLKTAFKDFNNVYVAQLDSLGQVLWASQSEAYTNALCLDLVVHQGDIYVCGTYEDTLRWMDKKALGREKTEAFQVRLATSRDWVGLETGQGGGFDVARGIAVDGLGYPWLVGGFQDSIWLGDSLGVAQGFADGFVWQQMHPNMILIKLGDWNPPIEIPETDIDFGIAMVYPNPARDSCVITISDNYPLVAWELHHKKRGLIKKGNSAVIPTKAIRPGNYCLVVHSENFSQQLCLRIK